MDEHDGNVTAGPSAEAAPAESLHPSRPAGRVWRRRTQTVAVIGLGYVGLPTSLALAGAGVDVLGLDVDPARLAAISAGRVDLLPADLERLPAVLAGRGHDPRDAHGQLSLTADLDGLRSVDAVLVCVPTPVDAHLVPDLGAVSAACRAVVECARRNQLIVLTSTSYAGTTRDLLIEPLARRGLRAGRDVFVAFAPERIDPANDRYTQDRVPRLVGGATPECTRRAEALLMRIAGGVHPVGSPEAAELAKLYENTFRAVNIGLANELSDLCGALDVDPIEVIDAAATKPYGFMPFYPGAGVGGHCIPVDPHYLLWQLRSRGVTLPIVEQAMAGIAARPARTADRVLEALALAGIAARGARALVAGVAYKPGVADVRMSPALGIIGRLARFGVDVSFHDPMVDQLAVDGEVLRSVPSRPGGDYDVIVLHTPHPGLDLGAFSAPVQVDCTYRSPSGVTAAPGADRPETGADVIDLAALDRVGADEVSA